MSFRLPFWGAFPLFLTFVAAGGDKEWKDTPFDEDEEALYFVGKGLDLPSYSEARETALAQALASILLYKGVRISGGLQIRRSEDAREFLHRFESRGYTLLREITVVREDTEVQTTSRGERRYSVWLQVRYPRTATGIQELDPEELRYRGEYLQALMAYREAIEQGDNEADILIQGIRTLALSHLSGMGDEDLQRELLRRIRGITLTPLEDYQVLVEGIGGPLENFPVIYRQFRGEEELTWTDTRGYARPSSPPVVLAYLDLAPIWKLAGVPSPGTLQALLGPLFTTKRVTFPLKLPWRSVGVRVVIEGAEPGGNKAIEDRIVQIITELGIRVSREPQISPIIEVTLHLLPTESFAGVYRARWEGSVRLLDQQQGVLLGIPISGGDAAVGKDPQRALRERQRLLHDSLPLEIRSLVGHFLENP